MPNTQEADKRLVAWLKERTDEQLERIMEAPEDGLTNVTWCGCLAGYAFGWEPEDTPREPWKDNEAASQATDILAEYGLADGDYLDDGTVFRRIKAYVAAELLTRRVNRKKLPPQASADGAGEAYAREAEK